MTDTEIVRFREMLRNSQEVIKDIPREHLTVVEKLAHERFVCHESVLYFSTSFFISDKTLPALCKSIKQQLTPEPLEAVADACTPLADKLPTSTLERAILSVAERVNYGADPKPTTSAPGGVT